MQSDETGVFRKILGLLRPHRLPMTVAIALALVSACITLAQPYLIGEVVGAAVNQEPIGTPLAILGGLFALDVVVIVVDVYLLGRVGTSVILGVRRELARKLLRAPVAVHMQRQRGDVIAGAVGDSDLLKSSLSHGLFGIAASGVLVIGAIVLMFIIDPLLTLSTLAFLAVMGSITIAISHKLRLAVKVSRDRVGDYGAALQRALDGVRTIKVSRAEQREQRRVDGTAEAAYQTAMRGVRYEAAMAPTMNLAIQGAFAAVFIIGAFRMASGSLDTAAFSAYLLYLLYLISPLMNVLNAVTQLQLGAASVMRLTGLLQVPEERSVTTEDTSDVTADGPTLGFDDVSFGYSPDSPVLHDVTFQIPQRGLTAIVGPSGSGKSTLFSLVERFWEPASGAIRLDGRDIGAIPLDELRGKVGYVEQDSPVVDGTIRENLTFARPEATDAELDAVIDKASLRSWIDSLPNGLDTEVGELGAAISGGERQRIAIGRMLLTNPEVLLLDEITSQLDSESEWQLRESIVAASAERAVVAIAHRMSTVVNAEQIIVLEGGRVRAIGDHETLLDSDDLYRRLVQGQSGVTTDSVPAEEEVVAS